MTGKKVFLLILILLGLGFAGFFYYKSQSLRQVAEQSEGLATEQATGLVTEQAAPTAEQADAAASGNSASYDSGNSGKSGPASSASGTISGQSGPEALGALESPEDIFTLALKEIELAQGGGGIEEWRLKANWAAMRKESDIINLTRPVVTYFMPENRGELQVTSSTGSVDQANRNVIMQGDVVAVNSDMTLKTTEMFYDSATRQMKFDKGASFSGEKVSGKADNLVWKMNERVIEATGDVVVDIKGGTTQKLF